MKKRNFIYFVILISIIFLTGCTKNTEPPLLEPIEAPVLVSPDNNALEQSIYNVFLTWKKCKDLNGNSLKYDVYIGKEKESLSKFGISLTGTSCEIVGLDKNTAYYWKVTARDINGKECSSQIWSFQTGDPDYQWIKKYGGTQDDNIKCISQTKDGGYILCGYTNSNDGIVPKNNGETDALVIKLKSNGNIEWAKTFGGTKKDTLNKIIQTDDGGFIAAGTSYSSDGDLKSNKGDSDFFIVKMKADGESEWIGSYGGSSGDNARSIRQTSDGGYIIAGCTSSEDNDIGMYYGSSDVWILKLTSNGNKEWARSYGGKGFEDAFDIALTSDGGYIAAGYTNSNDGLVKGNIGGVDFWLLKLNENGNETWIKCYGGLLDDYACSVIQTSDEGYIVAGYTNSTSGFEIKRNHGMKDGLIIKVNKDGITEWSKCYGGSNEDTANSISKTSDGYIICGTAKSTDGDVTGNPGNKSAWLFKIKENGFTEWSKNYGNTYFDSALNAQQTSDGGYVVSVNTLTESADIKENTDYMILKLDNNGNTR